MFGSAAELSCVLWVPLQDRRSISVCEADRSRLEQLTDAGMTQHQPVPVHPGGRSKPETSRLTEFDRELSSILAPPSFGPQVSITGNPLPRVDSRPDFKVVYVNGGEDVLINSDEETATTNTKHVNGKRLSGYTILLYIPDMCSRKCTTHQIIKMHPLPLA